MGNMVKNGLNGPRATPEEIANLTCITLLRTVPAAMPGIFFLSGDTPLDVDNEESATINLSKMNELVAGKLPWHRSFSYGKALQKTCIVTWLGKDENKAAANSLEKPLCSKFRSCFWQIQSWHLCKCWYRRQHQ